MLWIDYSINQYPDGSFSIEGDTELEVMDKGLYKPGDVFVVNDKGVLVKIDKLSEMILKNDASGSNK
tara:strand:- start:660 stop:860 length:201 start_codon:yes stop_codon:yes gene_type:complete